MSESDVQKTIQQLHSLSESQLSNASSLLSKAKISLLKLHALVPSPTTSTHRLSLAREVLEIGAFVSIRQRDPESFTRYYQQLQPFYSLPQERWGHADKHGNQSKITGLYMLLLLSQGDYAGFHTVIEGLEMAFGGKKRLQDDSFIQYPMRLEQALMEGSYDRVWGETKKERVPSPEFAVFSEVRPSSHVPSHSICVLTNPKGPGQHHPLRDCLMQRARLSFSPHLQRKKPPLPRL
jgi:26S proteasome regulatory subunit N12